jgi:MFS family permease
LAILIGLFLFALDNTILADVQEKIVDEFGSVDKVAWLAVAFMIPTAGLTLPNGQIFQAFNAKWLYIFGVATFEAGSALCGAAPNIIVFIFARGIAGLGAAFIYSGSLFLITVNTNEMERHFASSIIGADL